MTKATFIERKTNDASFQVGDLVQRIADGDVMLVTDCFGSDSNRFGGTVVLAVNSAYRIGFASNSFKRENFKAFHGSIRLDSE